MESYQSLETNKSYGRQHKRKLWANQKNKISDVYFFNQLVEPAYSTDGEQNAQYQSTHQVNQTKKTNIEILFRISF